MRLWAGRRTGYCLLPNPDKGTLLRFAACEVFALFRPHPQPLSHCMGEGHGAFPLSRLSEEGEQWGEGYKARLPNSVCAGKK